MREESTQDIYNNLVKNGLFAKYAGTLADAATPQKLYQAIDILTK